MTLLREKLSRVRLGDMILPGSHDSGTFGITENHTLVDRNEIFSIAPPEILANWSRNHDENFRQQLNGGYRYFDLRIASLDNGEFRWWHGVTADEIQTGKSRAFSRYLSNQTHSTGIENPWFYLMYCGLRMSATEYRNNNNIVIIYKLIFQLLIHIKSPRFKSRAIQMDRVIIAMIKARDTRYKVDANSGMRQVGWKNHVVFHTILYLTYEVGWSWIGRVKIHIT